MDGPSIPQKVDHMYGMYFRPRHTYCGTNTSAGNPAPVESMWWNVWFLSCVADDLKKSIWDGQGPCL
jgi:hypothetical protein